MPREHDKRARRPPDAEAKPEGLAVSGEIVEAADGKGLGLRAGHQRLELGRNPRGESAPVNETHTRYKETQARKFAEHG